MKVKLKTLIAGPLGTFHAGECADLPDDMAVDLLNGGYAESLEPVVERAEAIPEPMERAVVVKKGRKRK